MAFVELNNIGVSYDKKDTYVLEDLSIDIQEGELLSLLGPSGCGKTTTLRVIAGLINPQKGQFILDGQDMTDVPVHKRGFGMVFQSYALFPHLSVFDNVAFGLKAQKAAKAVIDEKVQRFIDICGLQGFEHRFPKQLSGGQRQRVALARALVLEPKLLLLDEPLSNLDAKLRVSMRQEIRRIQQQLGITTIFVTHDQEECFSISDKVAVMNQGVIEQFNSPEDIYRRPKSHFVADFIGFENFIPVQKQAGAFVDQKGSRFEVDEAAELGESKAAILTIRPADIQMYPSEMPVMTNQVQGKIRVRTYLGRGYQYEVASDCGNLVVTTSDADVFDIHQEVTLVLPSNRIILLAK
ncbi:ABC transporter ATP-binding protein [Aerococcaceae bacterium 50-4]